MITAAPELIPEVVRVTHHARTRYGGRRNTRPDHVDSGIRRLLCSAALTPTPPLRMDGTHGPHRSYQVSGFTLVLDGDLRTLITLWRSKPR